MSPGLLLREVPGDRLVVAIDPGKVSNRVWLTTGERGLIGEPVSLPVLGDGVDELERLIGASGVPGAPVIGVGDGPVASRGGDGDRASLAGIAAAVRPLGDHSGASAVGLTAV